MLRRLMVVVVAVACSGAAPAGAAGPPMSVEVQRASGVRSPYFSQAGRPGHRRSVGDVVVRNGSDRAVVVRLVPVNALTTDTLGSAYGATGAMLRGAARWVRLQHTRVRLAAGEARRVRVSVRVPESAKPGDYLAGVAVYSPTSTRTQRAGKGLAIGEEYRYAVGVETKVAGPRAPRIRFGAAEIERQPSAPVVLVHARNTGNATLKRVRGSVVVTQGEKTVARATIGPGTFVAGTRIAFPVRLNGQRPRAGDVYRVRARMTYGAERVTSLDTKISFAKADAKVQEQYEAPVGAARDRWAWWPAALAALLAAVLLACALWSWRRRVPGPRATRRGLDRALKALGEPGAAPVSVVLIAPLGGRRRARRTARGLRAFLPASCRVGRIDRASLLIVMPQTAVALRQALEQQLQAAVGGLDGRPVLTAVTVEQPIAGHDLLAGLRPSASHDTHASVALHAAA